MAKSPAHKWGQLIGDFIEEVFAGRLSSFASDNNLFLDKKGSRPARTGQKVSWLDMFGNTHDLDFVLERNGDINQFGEPVAFIECAWRRYTKHSRNKAQEIQGAILPLVTTHSNFAPFIGVILAGEFTSGARTQLKSLGFNLLYFPYDLLIEGFRKFGIDASFAETTTEKEFMAKILAWENFDQKDLLASLLIHMNQDEVDNFFAALEKSVQRFITTILITPLHGVPSQLNTLREAITFLRNYSGNANTEIPIIKYELEIRYNNGDRVLGNFTDEELAIAFLTSYRGPEYP